MQEGGTGYMQLLYANTAPFSIRRLYIHSFGTSVALVVVGLNQSPADTMGQMNFIFLGQIIFLCVHMPYFVYPLFS